MLSKEYINIDMQDPQIIQIEQERKPSLFYLHSVQCTHCTVFVHRTLYIVHCTLYILYCTMYIVLEIT